MVKRLSAALALLAAAGCTPDLDDRVSLVKGPRVLAVAATPAEAAPGAEVSFSALYVDPEGERSGDDLSWALCTARRLLTELGPVAPACLVPTSPALVPLGAGTKVAGTLPLDACRLFGPDRPEPKAGEPAGRPVDPDPTGGYHQPVRLRLPDDAYVTGSARLACGIGGATPAQAATFKARYRPNEAPQITKLVLRRGSGAEEPLASEPEVAKGERVTLSVAWPGCPAKPACGDGVCLPDEDAEGCAADCEKPQGCGGAETYLFFDPDRRVLTSRREGMRVAWFVTAGALEEERTGRDEAEADKTTSDNGWIAPAASGEVRVWVVLRDDRGGVGWASGRIRVGP